MPRKPLSPSTATRRLRGFEAASGLLKEPIRTVGETRGFTVAKLFTHWAAIVGEDLAACTRPIKVGYGREGLGATLTVLTQASHAPVLQMELPRIKDRVNACYGYAAIARITITQTAAMGFAEGQAVFAPAAAKRETAPDPAVQAAAIARTEGIRDSTLRAALETLAQNVLSRTKPS